MSKTVGLLFFFQKQKCFFFHSFGPFTAPGRQSSEGALSTRSALKDLNQNWPQASQPGVEPPPVVRGAPIPVFLAPQTVNVRALAAKMRDRIRTRPEWVLLDAHACRASMHSQRHTISAEQGFAHRQKRIFVFFVRQDRFSRAARSQQIPENCAL
jgi:hypothetical protein